MKKKIVSRMLFTLLLLSASTSVFSIQPAQAPTEMATVYVEPALSSAFSGESVAVDIMVRDVELLYAWQVYMIFNPSVLQFVSVTEGDFLKSQPEGTWTVDPYVNNSGGSVLFGWSTVGTHLGVNGSGWLATMEFSVADSGISVLYIDNDLTKLIKFNPPPPPLGHTVMELIPHAGEDGCFSTEVAELLKSYAELSANYDALWVSYNSLLASYNSQTSIYQSLLTEYQDLQNNYEDSESDYATLCADYDSLDSTYLSLQSEQDDLQSRYDKVSGDFATATNLNYLLALIAAIFAVATLFLWTRKKKS